MIIACFMEISLGHARIQVNTQRRVNDDTGLGPRLMGGPEPWPYWKDRRGRPRAFEPLEDQRRPSDRARHNRAYFIYFEEPMMRSFVSRFAASAAFTITILTSC